MTQLYNRVSAVLLGLIICGLAAPAFAVPISYTFTGNWDLFWSAPFAANYTATIVFDNGGSTVDNQTFVQGDFVSATLFSGTYNETALGADISFWYTDFQSNAAGQMFDGWFDAILANGDSWHFDLDFSDENFFETATGGSAGFFQSSTSGVGVVAAPEPGTMALLGLGLIGAALLRRRIK